MTLICNERDMHRLLGEISRGDLNQHDLERIAAVMPREILEAQLAKPVKCQPPHGSCNLIAGHEGRCDAYAHDDGSPHKTVGGQTNCPVCIGLFEPYMKHRSTVENGTAEPADFIAVLSERPYVEATHPDSYQLDHSEAFPIHTGRLLALMQELLTLRQKKIGLP